MPHGGKRQGAGRPPGTVKEDRKVQVGVRLPAWQVEWVRREGRNITREIEAALSERISRLTDQ